jgi:tetratricopeptide (TPR) repeat protein
VEQLYDDARELLDIDEREEASTLAQEAFRQLLTYHERNPLALRTQILLAETAALLVEMGAVDFTDEMVLRYQELANQLPSEAGVLATVANAYAAAERYEESLAIVQRSIELEAVTRPIPQAWWVRGIVLERLDRDDEAIDSLNTAIERGPESTFAVLSHLSLEKIYEKRGDTEQAEFHRAAAEELETELSQ